MQKSERLERYTRLANWAFNRYQCTGGVMTHSRGMKPTTYTKIENAAAVKYLKIKYI